MTHTPDLEVRNAKLIQWFDKYLADETWKSLCLGREDFAWILGEIKELTEQRAGLLAALKRIAATKSLKMSELDGQPYNWEIAGDAISKYEGKT